jgi:undecaprenyl pyrophosphate phosphatase UppP
MNPIAVVWTALMVVVFCLPFFSTGVPWEDDFDWNAFNYTPLVVGVVGVGIALAWFLGMNKRYTGPIRQIEFDEAVGIKSEEPAPAAGGSESP